MNRAWATSELRQALSVMAAPAETQIAMLMPGCVTCDLLNDIDCAVRALRGVDPTLFVGERAQTLSDLDAAMLAMPPADAVCFDNELLHRPSWQLLRDKAREVLDAFGWDPELPAPPTELG